MMKLVDGSMQGPRPDGRYGACQLSGSPATLSVTSPPSWGSNPNSRDLWNYLTFLVGM
jgi:hypothetical protein